MGRRKRKVMKPWCWYCNREFEDEKVLVYHQKSKHYRCQICRKKLFSAMGLSVHCMQVHKETITSIPNALPHRTDLDIEIFGMDGIPQEDIDERMRILNGESKPSIKAANTSISGTSQNSSLSQSGGSTAQFSPKFVPPPPASLQAPPPPPPPPSVDAPPPPPPPADIGFATINPQIVTNNQIPTLNLLDLNQFKKFNVCISASSIIVHPEYDISLEEYRLSQREYRMCSTLPVNGGAFFGNGNMGNNVRPPTVAYGYLRMSSAFPASTPGNQSSNIFK